MVQENFGIEGRAGGLFDQFRRFQVAALAMHIFAQPGIERFEIAASDGIGDLAVGFDGGGEKLSRRPCALSANERSTSAPTSSHKAKKSLIVQK